MQHEQYSALSAGLFNLSENCSWVETVIPSDTETLEALQYHEPQLSIYYQACASDLSGADVAEGGEVEEEVVVGERRLGVGNAAVVTCAAQETLINPHLSLFVVHEDRPLCKADPISATQSQLACKN